MESRAIQRMDANRAVPLESEGDKKFCNVRVIKMLFATCKSTRGGDLGASEY